MQAVMIYRTAAFCLALAFCDPAWAEEPVPPPDQKDFVESVLPYPLETIHDRVGSLFDSETRDYYDNYPGAIYDLPNHATAIKDISPDAAARFLAFPLVRANKFYVFFAAYPNMQRTLRDLTPVAAMGHSNAALQRYAALPQEARINDFYLWSPDAPFWYSSQYTLHDKPLPFHSYFIIHLTSVDDIHTNIEVIEEQPVVKMGRKLSVDEHGTLHRFDVREVEPTTHDREFLLSCIRQFIERKVPGRHWFSCKTDAELAEPPPVPFTVP
jgi:hypothetical protein